MSNFCQNCGAMLDDNTTFCSSCGTPCSPSENIPQNRGGYPQQGGYIPQQPSIQPQQNGTAAVKQNGNTIKKLIIFVVILVVLTALAVGGVIAYKTFLSNPFEDLSKSLKASNVTKVLGKGKSKKADKVYCTKYLYGVKGNVYVYFNEYDEKYVDGIVWTADFDSEDDLEEFQSKAESKMESMAVPHEFEADDKTLRLIFTPQITKIDAMTKDGALTNASSIELAIKNAQADIDSKNYETFSKTEMGAGGTGITIAKVAEKKGLKDAFDTVHYKGDTYDYYWASNDQKVYVLTSKDKKRIDTGDAIPASAGTLTKLTATGTETIVALTGFTGYSDGGSDTSSSGGSNGGGGETILALSVDDIFKNEDLVLMDEGKDSEVALKVWAPADALEVFQAQCDDFVKGFPNRKIKIEVVAQGESDATANVMNDPDAAADVFGFMSDHASNLYPNSFVMPVRLDFAAGLKETNIQGAIDVATNQDGQIVAFPETGDNGYFVYYNKSLISADEIKSIESIMKVCDEKDKQFIMSLGNGYYGCVIPLTGGGKYSLDSDGGQLLDYDKAQIVKTAKAFADTLASNSHFSTADTDKVLASDLKQGKALAGVSGTWKKQSIQAALGDNFACAKLPTIKIDGKDTDMVSMFGYKMIGVNSNTRAPYTAQALAYYLTGEKCQTERIDRLGWGPSIKTLVESDKVKNDTCLSAVYAQQAHSVPQIGLAGSFWDPTGAFAAYVTEKKNDLSEAGIAKAYDSMYNNITAK